MAVSTTIPYIPTMNGYSSQWGKEFITFELGGGMSKARRDKIGAPDIVSVEWQLTPTQRIDMIDIYNTDLEGGSLKFYVYLPSNSSTGTELRIARFLEAPTETWEGRTIRLTATIEVESFNAS